MAVTANFARSGDGTLAHSKCAGAGMLAHSKCALGTPHGRRPRLPASPTLLPLLAVVSATLFSSVCVQRCFVLPNTDPLSELKAAMSAENKALFKRVNDIATVERVSTEAVALVSTGPHSHAARTATHTLHIHALTAFPLSFAVAGFDIGVQCMPCNITQAMLGGSGAGGGTGSAVAGPSQTSSAVAGSATHTERVVCCNCGHHSRSVRGHQVHCSVREGSKVRCKGAACIPLSAWNEQREQEAAAEGVRAMAARHFVDAEAGRINSAMHDLFYNKMTPQTTIDSFGSLLKDHDARCKAELLRRLGDGKTPAEKDELAQRVADIFSSSSQIETKGELYERVNPAPARRRDLVDRPDKNGRAQGPRRGDHVYDVPICDGLRAIVRDNPHVLTTWQQAADSWASPKAGESITTYCDITDGSVFREHPELGIDADADWSDNSLRLGFIIYYDEVEVCNAIGHNCGVHKIGLFYWGILNYDASVRMDLNNIQLATVVLDADVSYYGVEQIVSGPPGEPNWPHGTSIGASLRALDTGITIPESKDGDYVDKKLCGWLILVSADNPAAALLTGTMIATGANRFCRQCTVDRTKAGFDAPCSFVSDRAPAPELRTQANRLEDMESCGNDQKKMHAAGWKSWSHAFARCGPHFDFLTSIPEDLMHDLFEGITKGELAHFIFYCEREKGFFKLDDLNKQLDLHDWPGGNRPCPYFTRSFLLGETANVGRTKAAKRKKQAVEEEEEESTGGGYVPKSGAHVHMTAGQMLTFARHSTQLFINLGVPPDDPAFQAWQTHMSLINLLMQHSLTPDEIQQIDQTIQSHQEQLQALSEVYPNIWKPKHHYACHFPLDIQHFGPPRHYWCMRFEAMNQVFKKIAVGGSYRDTTRRLAEFWCMRSALARQSNRPWEDWANTRILRGTETLTLAREDLSDHTQAALEAFSDSFGDVVTTSLISELQHDGHTITEECWLYLKLDSQEEPVLVSLHPHSAMFTMDGTYFFHVKLFPGVPLSSSTPLRTATIPAGVESILDIVALDEILEMTVLWPSFSDLSSCERGEQGSLKLVFTQI